MCSSVSSSSRLQALLDKLGNTEELILLRIRRTLLLQQQQQQQVFAALAAHPACASPLADVLKENVELIKRQVASTTLATPNPKPQTPNPKPQTPNPNF